MAKDWTKLYKKYKGLWVALAEDETTVLAADKNARKAWLSAKETGTINPILTRVPESTSAYVGAV